jgi:MoaA/NifB/PqqE/SkfB family radical SAM enzyme
MSAWVEFSLSNKCPNNCKYCPTPFLQNNNEPYKFLSFDNFKIIIDKIPNNSIVVLSGFVEPATNPDIVFMIEYAHNLNHKVYLLTTLFGLDIHKYDRIKDVVDYFSIHLPNDVDQNEININNNNYIDLLEYILNNKSNGEFICNHHMGNVDDRIKHLVDSSILLKMHDRSGILSDVAHTYNDQANKCGHSFLDTYEDFGCVVDYDGKCYLCCNDFEKKHYLGNILTESWDKIKDKIYPTELCKKCICGVK